MGFKLLRHRLSGIFRAGFMMFALVQTVHGQQTSEKLIHCNDPAQITDPVLISDVAVAGETVECGLFINRPSVVQPVTAFQAGSGWLQQMKISLINRTNQTIVAGTISLLFLDNAADCRMQVCPLEQMRVGQRPAADSYDGRTGRPLKQAGTAPLDWKPGQTLTVHVGDFMPEIAAKLSNQESVGEVSKLSVHVGPFFFQDGMMWSYGAYSVPIPEHPGKFRNLRADYFPGPRAHNWPPGYNP